MKALHATYLSRRSKSRLSTIRWTIYAAVGLWVISVFATEIARSLTQIDVPSESAGFEFLFGLLYHAIPQAASVLYIPLHLYWAGAAASTAGRVFLSRKGVPSDLLSITSVGMRRFVLSRFLWVCRAYWPYALLNAGMIWTLALYYGYENPRITYFYWSANRPRFIVEVAPITFFPPIGQLLIPAVVALIASIGTLLLISAGGVAAAALTPPRFHLAAGVVSRLLIWGAAFGLVTLNRWRMSSDVIGPVIGMFLDSGLSHTGGYLFASFASAPPGLPAPIHLIDRTGNLLTAPLYLIVCAVLAWLILALTIRLLRRR